MAESTQSSSMPTRPGKHTVEDTDDQFSSAQSSPSFPTMPATQDTLVPDFTQDGTQTEPPQFELDRPDDDQRRPASQPLHNASAPHNLAFQQHDAPEQDSFVAQMQLYQQQLEEEYCDFEQSLQDRDHQADLDDLDWEDMESRYNTEIGPKVAAEHDIIEQFAARFQVLERNPFLVRS